MYLISPTSSVSLGSEAAAHPEDLGVRFRVIFDQLHVAFLELRLISHRIQRVTFYR